MQLAEVVTVSGRVAATRSRNAKRDLIAELLRHACAEEVEIATAYLSGTLTQRRTGVGWRGLSDLPGPADRSTLSLTDVSARLDDIACLTGAGSGTSRARAITDLFGALTAPEQDYLRRLITGNVRQGALDSVMLDAVAAATGIPAAQVRRAATFSALTGPIARAALTGGAEALAAFDLRVGRPVRPMLAASAPDVTAAVGKAGGGTVGVDTKLDGIRIQAHKDADRVWVFTRGLEEVSARLPRVVEAVRALPAARLILDGEALLVDDAGRPRPFQETASQSASTAGDAHITPFFFDLLLDDADVLLRRPLAERLARLDLRVPESLRVRRVCDADLATLEAFYADAVGAGQEGVVVKRLDAPYDAGRRGSAWVKVKPRHTLDLVVLAVEWGSGRRQGLLSNIHLGARDPGAPDGYAMLGKTFKGMTDEMLAWQTQRFLELETHRDGHVVHVRPEQVVEIAFDGVQRSSRYAGGAALRFARVVRYRDDKAARDADTIDTVRTYLASKGASPHTDTP